MFRRLCISRWSLPLYYRAVITATRCRLASIASLLVWYQSIRSALFGFVTKDACDRLTDRQTDRQNYDSYHAIIAAGAVKIGKNSTTIKKLRYHLQRVAV